MAVLRGPATAVTYGGNRWSQPSRDIRRYVRLCNSFRMIVEPYRTGRSARKSQSSGFLPFRATATARSPLERIRTASSRAPRQDREGVGVPDPWAAYTYHHQKLMNHSLNAPRPFRRDGWKPSPPADHPLEVVINGLARVADLRAGTQAAGLPVAPRLAGSAPRRSVPEGLSGEFRGLSRCGRWLRPARRPGAPRSGPAASCRPRSGNGTP
jgi:hypothetical protein